jgi:hypothetical protein
MQKSPEDSSGLFAFMAFTKVEMKDNSLINSKIACQICP